MRMAGSRWFVVIFFLFVAAGGSLAQRSKLDTRLAVTAAEARACEHMRRPAPKGQATDIWFNPYELKGIQAGPNQTVWGTIFPNTPVFKFMYHYEAVFENYEINYPQPVDCGLRSPMEANNRIYWNHVPDGDYLVTIYVREPTRIYEETTSSESGTTSSGEAVTLTSHSAGPKTVIATHVQHVAIHTQGGKLTMAQWEIVKP